LISTFRFLGDKYDFSFNFRDVGAVVCAEVQYHALDGKGDIAFELTRRAGNPTQSADDIINYYEKRRGSFEFVLLALEDTHSPCHDAKIYVGEDGENMLKKLMISEETKSRALLECRNVIQARFKVVHSRYCDSMLTAAGWMRRS
jgi:hypothetical protein